MRPVYVGLRESGVSVKIWY